MPTCDTYSCEENSQNRKCVTPPEKKPYTGWAKKKRNHPRFHYKHFLNHQSKMHKTWCTSASLYPECSHKKGSFKFQSAATPSSENQAKGRVGSSKISAHPVYPGTFKNLAFKIFHNRFNLTDKLSGLRDNTVKDQGSTMVDQ